MKDQHKEDRTRAGAVDPSASTHNQPTTDEAHRELSDDDEEAKERGLSALNQMHEELQQKKHRLDALDRQGRLRVIRQKAAEAREKLRRMDKYLAAAEANLDLQSDLGTDQLPLPEHPAPEPRRSPPAPPPPNPEQPQPNPQFNQLYPGGGDQHIPHPPQRNQPQPMQFDPKSPLTQILQTKSWPLAYKPQHLPRYDGHSNP